MTLPQPPAAPPGKYSTGFWVLVIGGCLGAGAFLLVGGLIVLGVIGALVEDPPPPGAASTPGTSGGITSTPAPNPGEPDDFLYTSKTSGLQFIAPNSVVAEGVSVTLVGDWREDHRSVILRLREGGHYELVAGGGALPGRRLADTVASSTAEQGTWTFEGGTLTLTPEARNLSGIAEGKSSSGNVEADPPRQWAIAGVTIEYTPQGATAPKQRAGLRINGPGPSWYYPPGNWNWVLRKAW